MRILLAFCAIISVGCGSAFQVTHGGANGPKLDLERVARDDQATVAALVSEICAVVAEEKFKTYFPAQVWTAANAAAVSPGAPWLVPVEQLVDDARGACKPDKQLQFVAATLRRPWFAIAATDPPKTGITPVTITIRQGQIDKGHSPAPSDRAELVNTLAHELVHTIPVANAGSKYLDRGHQDVAGSHLYLASYRTGAVVACMWLEKQLALPGFSVETCLASRL